MRLFSLLLFTASIAYSFECSKTGYYENHLEGTRWQVDGVPFETSDRENYSLTKVQDEEYSWGNFIMFDDHTFTSSYSAPCGNDCFTSVTGRYKYIDLYTIRVTVQGINYSGFCQQESKEGFQFREDYEIEISTDNIILSKVS